MRLSNLMLGAAMVALALPAHAQTVPAPAPLPDQAAPGRTTTLREAMVMSYNTNPDLEAERANLRATDENVPIARAAGRPGLASSGGYVENLAGTDNTLASPARQATAGIDLTVPIFQGGAVRNSIRAAETRVEAGRAGLRTAEAQLFTQVVAAYMDVIRDEAVVRLNQQNLRALQVNLQATRDRFEVGDLTRTDVAQSEARLAGAEAQLRAAEAGLIGSRETYIRVVGAPPGDLAQPPALPNLPPDVASAVQTALANNPTLQQAQLASDATRFDVDVAEASRLPRVNVVVGGDYYNYLGSLGAGTGPRVGQSGTSATAGVALQVPLFQGGRPAAQVRQAEALRGASLEQVTSTERGVVAQTRSAYATWQSSLRVIESSRIAVEANRLSLEGVRAENSVGTRTILDILNAEQEYLNSQVLYVTAQRDAYVAGFALLAIMGQAEARDLGLDGGALYDPTINYNRVNRSWSDWRDGPEAQPQGTRTIGTPAQTPNVTPGTDPLLDRPVDTNTGTPAGN